MEGFKTFNNGVAEFARKALQLDGKLKSHAYGLKEEPEMWVPCAGVSSVKLNLSKKVGKVNKFVFSPLISVFGIED